MAGIFFLEVKAFGVRLEDRILRDVEGREDFVIRIQLKGLPNLDLPVQRFSGDLREEKLEDYVGRGCHFVAKKEEAVQMLRRGAMRVGVYVEEDKFPLCKAKEFEESGCFETKGISSLLDPGGNPAGQVSLEIILSNLGSHVVTSYAPERDSFVLKSSSEGPEYRCGRIKDPDCDSPRSDEDGYLGVLIPEKMIRDTVGISLGASELCRGKPEVEGSEEQLEVEPKVEEEKVASRKKGRRKNK